jgi:hypothetical protein
LYNTVVGELVWRAFPADDIAFLCISIELVFVDVGARLDKVAGEPAFLYEERIHLPVIVDGGKIVMVAFKLEHFHVSVHIQ